MGDRMESLAETGTLGTEKRLVGTAERLGQNGETRDETTV